MKNILLKEVSIDDENPFRQFPELKSIWLPDLAMIAEEAIDESFKEVRLNPKQDIGEIYLVYEKNTNKLMGITGFFPIAEEPDKIYLRWHGLLAEYKKMGYSKEIILFLAKSVKEKYPSARALVEYMPVIPEYIETSKYFESLGFKKVGNPENVQWTSYPWQSYELNI